KQHSEIKYLNKNQGKIKEIIYEQYDSINNKYIKEYTSFIFYNTQGQRVKDSIALTGIRDYYVLDLYEYNTFGECKTKYSLVYQNQVLDTTMIELITYDNGNISRLETFVKTPIGLEKTELQRFSYNENGLVTNALIYNIGANQEPILRDAYYLNYNSMGKLAFISLYVLDENTNKLEPTDSVSLSYLSNGNITTSYGYGADLINKKWTNSPTYRIVFDGEKPTSVAQNSTAKNLFNIYPNPATNVLNIEAKASTFEASSFSIINLQGQIIKHGPIKETINIDDLAEGFYLIRLESNQQVYQTKFIKQ
ncbi:MAG: T9SS type A sorting domain-containing protein, partial [Bacteroidia bacterium]|nr:T9SS type A sorting domain-containing protein [Bacteroidia bacterium]